MILSKLELAAVKRGEAIRFSMEGIEIVCLRADLYDRVRKISGDDLTHEDLRTILAHTSKNSDWNNPAMDIYEDYDKYCNG